MGAAVHTLHVPVDTTSASAPARKVIPVTASTAQVNVITTLSYCSIVLFYSIVQFYLFFWIAFMDLNLY